MSIFIGSKKSLINSLSLNQQSALNIVGSIIVVAINTVINLVLSPYIVSHLGVEANGYITLANNFVSYIALVTIALNSMAGRFILIDYRRGNQQSANEYYSSVLLGDWILAAIFFFPMLLFIIFIDSIINISSEFLWDTRILFAVVFINYMLQLCVPQWQTATYCTNNLYLRSLRNAVSAIVRAIAIYLLFLLFTPHSFYVAFAATLMSVVSISMDYAFYKRLMPELQWSFSSFNISKVKVLVSSGIWNTISQCGNILLEGLDILIANIFINPVASGVLALSKMIPNMINQITGTVATTYGPRLAFLYADGKMEEMAYEVKNDIMVVSLLANIPIGVFVAFGTSFFSLWIPSQNAVQLTILSGFSLLGMLFAGTSQCFVNIFGIVNQLKLNSLVVIGSGLVNIICVSLLLKFSDFGIYSVVVVSSIISIIRIFSFTIPYSAKLIHASAGKFAMHLIKGVSNVFVPLAIGFTVNYIVDIHSWMTLIACLSITIIMTLSVDCFIVFNNNQRNIIFRKLRIIR